MIHNINTSIIVYADDIILISPLETHHQSLLDICAKYGKDWNIKFNTQKSNIIHFGKYLFESEIFYLNKSPSSETENIKYLGTFINNKLDFDKI